MAWLGIIAGSALIIFILIDAFEVMILPRRVRHPLRLAQLYYRSTWRLCRWLAGFLPQGRLRHSFLGVFGPFSLFALISIWAFALITGFALIGWAGDAGLKIEDGSFVGYLYMSGTTFFTLGYGDLVPTTTWGRVLAVSEAGIGFTFLAIIVSYLPILYQAFSRREIPISLLDARAGSPPTAGELLRRMAKGGGQSQLTTALCEWERWSAEILENHLSFPVLSYYRSQHDNQSWVAALTTMLDTSALLIASDSASHSYQARLTFAMARHAAVDLALVFMTPPLWPAPERLADADLARLRTTLRDAGMELNESEESTRALTQLRALYEPVVNALANYLLFTLPGFAPSVTPVDNWQTSPWLPRSPGLVSLPGARVGDEHFD
jgi:hypothetical protein